jgi:hypothetical protein
MTVKPGQEWGTEVATPIDAIEVSSDRALATRISAGDSRPVLLRGGDLHRSLGSPAGRTGVVRRLPIDILHVTADDVERCAVAHVIVRNPGLLGWWRGPIVCVGNVDHVGAADVLPRAHPNDGRLDILEVDPEMTIRARLQASRRLTTGTHLPHPAITTRQSRQATFTFGRPLALWVDGVACGSVRALRVTVEPDAADVYA